MPSVRARVLRSGRRIWPNVGKEEKEEEEFRVKKLNTEAVNKKKFGIVYSRKRKRLSEQSRRDKSEEKRLKFYCRRRRRLSLSIPLITLRVDGGCKEECWFSSVFRLVMRYSKRQEELRLSSLASFFLSQPIKDVFANHGVRFLAKPPLSSRGVCKFFGAVNCLPLFSIDFTTIPRCFIDLHYSRFLRVALHSFTLLYLLNNPVEESELVLLEPCTSSNGGVVNAQCRGFQKRRSSLRRRRSRTLASAESSRKLQSSVLSNSSLGSNEISVTPKPKTKEEVDSLCSSANVLMIDSDRCTREEGFSVIYKECYEQNAKTIPIPGVKEVCGYDLPSFCRPVSYISVKEDEVSRAMARSIALYDIDSEDEEWLKRQNSEELDQDSFELMIDGFEKFDFHHPADEKAAIVASLSYLSRQEVIEAVHDYWVSKRKHRKASLLRVFQAHQAKKTPLFKPVFRKRRSFKRQGSQLHGKAKQLSIVAVKAAAEQEAWEEQNVYLRVEEARALYEIAIAKRRRAQVVAEQADLAVYKAMMALRIAEAIKVAESSGGSSHSPFLELVD